MCVCVSILFSALQSLLSNMKSLGPSFQSVESIIAVHFRRFGGLLLRMLVLPSLSSLTPFAKDCEAKWVIKDGACIISNKSWAALMASDASQE